MAVDVRMSTRRIFFKINVVLFNEVIHINKYEGDGLGQNLNVGVQTVCLNPESTLKISVRMWTLDSQTIAVEYTVSTGNTPLNIHSI